MESFYHQEENLFSLDWIKGENRGCLGLGPNLELGLNKIKISSREETLLGLSDTGPPLL